MSDRYIDELDVRMDAIEFAQDLRDARSRKAAGMSTPEPAPQPNQGAPIWDLVIADMRERDQTGRRKYGTPLQANNGRDPLVDAYQEALDLCVYLRQAIEERRR